MSAVDHLTDKRAAEIAELLRRLIEPKRARVKRARGEASDMDKKAIANGLPSSPHAASLRAGAETSEREAAELQAAVDDLTGASNAV